MSEYVARVSWDALETATGRTENGVALLRAEDVVILRCEVPRSAQIVTERMREFGTTRPSEEEVKRIIEEARNDPSANDVAVVWYSKAVQLSENYHISYAEHPAKDSLIGFGFSAGTGVIERERKSCRLTFSWEWFSVTGPDKAVNHEGGEMTFQKAETACGREITHMVFSTDISFRIRRRGVMDPRSPDWRINVHQGSEIYWPSWVEGSIVANGYLSD